MNKVEDMQTQINAQPDTERQMLSESNGSFSKNKLDEWQKKDRARQKSTTPAPNKSKSMVSTP